MTDRELLEAAAKAAGIAIRTWSNCQAGGFLSADYLPEQRERFWNPLTDDGDALRLAVKLNLALVFHPLLNQALCRPYYTREMDAESREDGEKHSDHYAATRRAIVRAAAEIGREK